MPAGAPAAFPVFRITLAIAGSFSGRSPSMMSASGRSESGRRSGVVHRSAPLGPSAASVSGPDPGQKPSSGPFVCWARRCAHRRRPLSYCNNAHISHAGHVHRARGLRADAPRSREITPRAVSARGVVLTRSVAVALASGQLGMKPALRTAPESVPKLLGDEGHDSGCSRIRHCLHDPGHGAPGSEPRSASVPSDQQRFGIISDITSRQTTVSDEFIERQERRRFEHR